MWLVHAALRRPITIVVLVLGLVIAAGLAMQRMRADIFPALGSPTIYVAQPYSGMDPAQMEGFLTYYYEYHFLYVTGIEHVESKSIQGVSLMKLVFQPETNMNQAIAEVVAQVNRARAFMPTGAVPPFIVRFDAGSVPIGQLVFSSATRTPAEMQDFALNRVRPLFATLQGVSAPPPFGGNQRTIVVRVDPERMRAYRLSPEEVIAAVNRASTVAPSGVVRIGDEAVIATTNATVGGNLQEFMDTPVRTGAGPTVYVRDVGFVESSTDILTGYAHVNGKRTVYIPITKRSDASTLAVMERVRAALPAMQAVVPEDVAVRIEFDQTGYVARALRSLVNEGLLGALLTGLMVLLFLRDWRGALIVITTIPVALLSSVAMLWLSGQTINIMTLAGLALAVGILVDEATVEIENVHAEMARGGRKRWAVLNAASRTATPRLLAMLSMLAVFVPSLFMTGVARQMFVPLSLAVGFAMISSYVLSSTLVPVLASWLMRTQQETRSRLADLYAGYVRGILPLRWPLFLGYVTVCGLLVWALLPGLGVELLPQTDAGLLQVRLRAPTGTRIERTEQIALQGIDLIRDTVGKDAVSITTDFVGVQPASYPVNTIYLWTSGPHEAVLSVALNEKARLRGAALQEELRQRFRDKMPQVKIQFEAADLVSKVLSFGADTQIEVAAQGPALAANREFAGKLYQQLGKLGFLRDLQYAQTFDYPTLQIDVDRERAGQYGLTTDQVARSLVTATSSSRFIAPNYWRDPVSGNGFQIQVEVPQYRVKSAADLNALPVSADGALLGEVASIKQAKSQGVVERYNGQRVVSMTANVHGVALGQAAQRIREAIRAAGEPPRGVTVALRGQVPALEETISGLRTGLLLSIGVVFLLLTANFQSLRLAFAVLLTVPAALAGAVTMLTLTGTTLNIQSFLGAIMSVGIVVANSILLVTFMEARRGEGLALLEAVVEGSRGRLRPVLMTASAMIAGMVPLAISGEQVAPLGRAVIGGLLFATVATLGVLPAIYAALSSQRHVASRSLHPEDEEVLA